MGSNILKTNMYSGLWLDILRPSHATSRTFDLPIKFYYQGKTYFYQESFCRWQGFGQLLLLDLLSGSSCDLLVF